MIQYTISPVTNTNIGSISFNEPNKDAHITFYAGQNEMLKVCADGFYVRGQKLDVDNQEAESVYRAFKEFLIWAALTKE